MANRDAEGLQAVDQHIYPEVVPQQDLRPISRRNSTTSPEAFSTPAEPHQQTQPFLSQNEKRDGAYGGAADGGYFAGREAISGVAPPEYNDHSVKEVESQGQPGPKRILGMRQKVFIFVIVIVSVVILAVALGVGLGVGLSGHSRSPLGNGEGIINGTSSDSSQYSAMDKTGVALLAPSGSSTLYSYYIDGSGTIIETVYENNAWSQNNTKLPSTTNITSLSAGLNTPLAAVSYTLQGNTAYRQLFFLDSQGRVATSNVSGNGNWSTPYNPVIGVAALPNTMSLSAVASTTNNALNGIRVYFGATTNMIQEIGMDFVESNPYPVWHVWADFPGSDANGGVGSTVVNNVNHLYLRNLTSGLLQQWTWNYVDVSQWTIGANSSSANGVAEGGSIAVTSDGQTTDYIFYQDSNQQTVEALYTGSGSSINAPNTNIQTIQAAPVGYTLAAAFSQQAVVANQNSSSTTELLFSSVGRTGQYQGYNTDTGRS